MARTVVDIADAASFDDGVVVADGALFAGLSRELLEQAADLAGPRRGIRRVVDVVSFAHPGAESANESRSRATMYRLGVEPPELQHEFWDAKGFVAAVDTYWERIRAVGETDGAKKYLDPRLARDGAGRAVYDEKRREDRVRVLVDALGRWGWAESCSTVLLRSVLAGIGVMPLVRRPTLADWAAVARGARPRRPRRATLSGVLDDAQRRERN